MSRVRPTLPRATAVLLIIVSGVLASASPALAHQGTGGASSDYRIEIVGWQGDHTGIELRVVELGDQLELRRTSAATVMILGYEGEPYLRLDAAGVAENVNSPAHYLNRDRFASTDPPASASPTAPPSWVVLSAGTTVRWHDHRAHWMSTTPRADVAAEPDVERVIFDRNPIDLIVDGREVSALIRVIWLPAPSRLVWLGTASAVGLVVAAVFVLLPRTKPLLPLAALLGAIAAILGQGDSAAARVLGAIAIALALLGLVVRKPLMIGLATGAAGAVAVSRVEVFEHELLAGWLPGAGQRSAITVAIAMSLGVVAAIVVAALEPTRSSDRAEQMTESAR